METCVLTYARRNCNKSVLWLLTCTSPQKTAFSFGEQQLLATPGAVRHKKEKAESGIPF